MKNFIEVTTAKGIKEMINIHSVAKFEPHKDGVKIYFKIHNQAYGLVNYKYVESYSYLKKLIETAQQ